MRLLPTTLPTPKTTNPNTPAPALVHLTEPSKTGVNSQNSPDANLTRLLHALPLGDELRQELGHHLAGLLGHQVARLLGDILKNLNKTCAE